MLKFELNPRMTAKKAAKTTEKKGKEKNAKGKATNSAAKNQDGVRNHVNKSDAWLSSMVYVYWWASVVA